MSYLLHGSTSHTAMGWVDRVPRCGRIYIGGLHALYQTDLIEAAGITHVLSVIDYDALLQEKFAHLKHFHIRAEDHPNANLLQYFQHAVQYIEQALESSVTDTRDHVALGTETATRQRRRKEKCDQEDGGGGGVFVHCAMGKSRSATLVCAYLIWKYHLSPAAALDQLCEGRPVCDPNPGFKEQLQVWHDMCRAHGEQEKNNIYEQWERDRFTGEVWDWEVRLKQQDMDKATSLKASKL